jgi:GNAT superfamily N-acetyltransferase
LQTHGYAASGLGWRDVGAAIRIRRLDPPRDAADCAEILAGLPEWFGLEEGRDRCARDVQEQPGLVAESGGAVQGFLTWREATAAAAEITWLAVRRERHRAGFGRSLVEEAAACASAAGLRVVTAWTVSDADPDPHYAATRAFYARLGFVPVAEANLWGPDNPAVLLARWIVR